jgi:hypothetical protein
MKSKDLTRFHYLVSFKCRQGSFSFDEEDSLTLFALDQNNKFVDPDGLGILSSVNEITDEREHAQVYRKPVRSRLKDLHIDSSRASEKEHHKHYPSSFNNHYNYNNSCYQGSVAVSVPNEGEKV